MIGFLKRWEVEPDEPTEFVESEAEMATRLRTTDDTRALETLAEAQRLFRTVEERAQGIERRATTLQGVVSVGATFALAGGSLLLGSNEVPNPCWRVTLTVFVLALVYCLAATAFRAHQAASKVHYWSEPRAEDIFDRAAETLAEARISLAASLLRCYGRNAPIARWKVAYFRAATQWFSRSLIAIVVLALGLSIYGLTHFDDGHDGGKTGGTPMSSESAREPTRDPDCGCPGHDDSNQIVPGSPGERGRSGGSATR